MRISNTGTTKVSKCEKKEGKRDTMRTSILYYIWVARRNKGDFVGLFFFYLPEPTQFNERHNDGDD